MARTCKILSVIKNKNGKTELLSPGAEDGSKGLSHTNTATTGCQRNALYGREINHHLIGEQIYSCRFHFAKYYFLYFKSNITHQKSYILPSGLFCHTLLHGKRGAGMAILFLLLVLQQKADTTKLIREEWAWLSGRK